MPWPAAAAALLAALNPWLSVAVHAASVRGRSDQHLQQRSALALRSSSSVDGYTSAQGATATGEWTATFYAPQLTPTSFLFISVPSLGKVVYTELKNFKSKYSRTYALIDSGLMAPSGIAFDGNSGYLYVADPTAQAIYRYSIVVSKNYDRDGTELYNLATDGIRLTILSGYPVSWVAVDQAGDLFYSDGSGGSVNKITANVMSLLGDGEFQASSLTVISEQDQEAASSASVAAAMNSDSTTVTDAPAPAPSVLALYQSTVNSHVSTPAGVATDGLRLYWANSASGTTAGSCIAGEVDPVSPPTLSTGSGPSPFPSTAISNVTSAAYGVAKTANIVFFSSSGTNAGGVVYGVPMTGGTAYTFASGLTEPRGLVWDGDQTVFVADQAANAVYSFPAGRLMDSAPLTETVDIVGAFGVALLQRGDPAFNLKAQSAAAARGLFVPLLALLCSAYVFA